MPPVISDDMVLEYLPPRAVICIDVYMLDVIDIDAHWQRCDD